MTNCINQATEAAAAYKAEALPTVPMELSVYRPREIVVNGKGAGKYRYTRLIYPFGIIQPVGYCAEDCPGHDSWNDAYEHYRQYLLDHALHACNWEPEHLRQKIPSGACAVCGEPGFHTFIVEYGEFDSPSGWSWCLCEQHQTRETVERLFHPGDFDILNWTHHINMANLNEYADTQVDWSD